MSKILLIGNTGFKNRVEDGQTVKVRLYFNILKKEGFDIELIDLEGFVKRPIRILRRIKNGIKNNDRIILITATRGCRILIPYINFINRKYKKVFILPLIGTSVLHYSIDKLSDEEKNRFILDKDYSLCKPSKNIIKHLSKIDYVLPETDVLVDVFKGFYGLSNVFKLNNFRDISGEIIKYNESKDKIKIVYLSRVMSMKGVFDLLAVLTEVLKTRNNVTLDIYGKRILSKPESSLFESYLKNPYICYKGIVDNKLVCSTLSNYDLFVFPTRFVGEGTPGVIAESLIAGTPVLTVDFPQAKILLKNGVDSVFCKMFNREDLMSKLVYIIDNKNFLLELKKGARESGKSYLYETERSSFLKYICGVEEKEL